MIKETLKLIGFIAVPSAVFLVGFYVLCQMDDHFYTTEVKAAIFIMFVLIDATASVFGWMLGYDDGRRCGYDEDDGRE